MSVKSITLTGAEVAVMNLEGTHAHIRNDGTETIYATKTAGITVGADGVSSIPAGQAGTIRGISGRVYLFGTGSAHIQSDDYVESPFKWVSASGGADIVTHAAEAVTLDGLQDGVPFSNITLSGEEIVGQEITLMGYGENLLKFNGYEMTKTIEGVTFTRGTDGSITADGTATALSQYLSDTVEMTDGETYTMRGCPAGGSSSSYSITNQTSASISDVGTGKTFTYDVASFGAPRFKIRIAAGYTCDNLVFRPILCKGTPVTAIITTDTSPYAVPNDIRQQDGVNNVTVLTGNVQVTGVKRNAALKKVWDKLDELTAAVIVSSGEITE